MNKNYLIFLKLILKKNTLLRALQIYKCLNINLYGISLELGTIRNNNKTFSNFVNGKSKFHFSNKISNKKSNIFYSDLTKKIKVSTKTYDNVLLFNVLEHLPEYKLAFSEIYRILKTGGNFIGSVPFIYQIHGAPKDYYRFSKQFFELNLKKYRFKKIKVKSLGFGPFIASYSLLHSYLKYLPFLSQICLLLAFILDSFIQIFVKTNLEEIFPIGYFFIAKK
jgi:SAM-dependent methyltransferase